METILGRHLPEYNKTFHGKTITSGATIWDRSALEIDLPTLVFETRLKPAPTKAKRYGGRS